MQLKNKIDSMQGCLEKIKKEAIRPLFELNAILITQELAIKLYQALHLHG